MIVTEENEKYVLEAMKTDILTEQWERERFTGALMAADAWGKKVEKQNKEYKKRNRLIDKYNL